MYLTTKPGIVKIVTIVIGVIGTAIGCVGHFESVVLDLLHVPGFEEMCRADSKCPIYAIVFEYYFVSISIIFLVLSVASLVLSSLGFDFKLIDKIYHGVGGVLILLAGIFMLVSPLQLDKYITDNFATLLAMLANMGGQGMSTFVTAMSNMSKANIFDPYIKEIRKEMKYTEKLAAGAITIINGIVYFVAAVLIKKNKTEDS